ncbi:hypothetical protein ACKS0A_00044 [Histoplasma ohiense]
MHNFTPVQKVNSKKKKLDASLNKVFRKHLVWEELEEIGEPHPKWLIDKTLVHSIGTGDFEGIKDSPDKLFPPATLEREIVKMLGNCNLMVLMLFCSLFSDAHFESDISMFSIK